MRSRGRELGLYKWASIVSASSNYLDGEHAQVRSGENSLFKVETSLRSGLGRVEIQRTRAVGEGRETTRFVFKRGMVLISTNIVTNHEFFQVNQIANRRHLAELLRDLRSSQPSEINPSLIAPVYPFR